MRRFLMGAPYAHPIGWRGCGTTVCSFNSAPTSTIVCPRMNLTVVFHSVSGNSVSPFWWRERTKIPDHDGISTQTRRVVELQLAGDLTPLSKTPRHRISPAGSSGEDLVRKVVDSLQTLSSACGLFTFFCGWNGRWHQASRAFWMPCGPIRPLSPPLKLAEDFADLGDPEPGIARETLTGVGPQRTDNCRCLHGEKSLRIRSQSSAGPLWRVCARAPWTARGGLD